MAVYNRIADFQEEMAEWRQDIHKYPELCFKEDRTADVVAAKLEEFGIEVHRGLAVTGVVGVLKGQGDSGRTIGLRADLDALPMQEMGNPEYKSVHDGSMHACGHDGHTAMLLGAAKYLSETKNFDGTVNFIFQPAEEGGAGGDRMVKEGLFEQHPCQGVYGMHNTTQFPKGTFSIRKGPLLSAADSVNVVIKGKGGHAAMPHLAIDPVSIGVQLHSALQTIASRNADPTDMLVISVCEFHAGTAGNVIPDDARLSASIRTMTKEMRALAERRIREICAGVAATHGVEIEVEYAYGYPATVNHDAETEIAIKAAEKIVGPENVDPACKPRMGSEDFAFMLEARPGAFIMLGTRDEGHVHSVHHPEYDFNDDALALGASYWASLVEQELARG